MVDGGRGGGVPASSLFSSQQPFLAGGGWIPRGSLRKALVKILSGWRVGGRLREAVWWTHPPYASVVTHLEKLGLEVGFPLAHSSIRFSEKLCNGLELSWSHPDQAKVV